MGGGMAGACSSYKVELSGKWELSLPFSDACMLLGGGDRARASGLSTSARVVSRYVATALRSQGRDRACACFTMYLSCTMHSQDAIVCSAAGS